MSGKATANFKDLATFCRQMNMVIRSDITLVEGVSIVAEQTLNTEIKKALIAIHHDMDGGKPFAISISEYKNIFPAYLLNMLRLGENSGNLDTVTEQLADYYEKENYFHNKLRSATIYPLILLILMTAVIILLLVKVLPTFQAILSSLGGELPVLTKVFLALGTFIGNFFIIFIILLLVLYIIGRLYSRSLGGRYFFDKLSLHLPGIGRLNRYSLTARFSRSMAILLKSGVPLIVAIESVSELIDNSYLAEKLKLSQDKISKDNMDFASALTSLNIFPPLFLRMAAIGEKTGNLDIMLSKSSHTFDEEANDSLERLSVMIEPALIIILSLIVTVILLSVMLPMINIISSIG